MFQVTKLLKLETNHMCFVNTIYSIWIYWEMLITGHVYNKII